ncbi:cyclin-dependent kinase-activating kinase assembly factor-related [Abeliophyllum distichum]|uniref:Cyclin-dependent kinase-activating kinase assembly factor-related n=1 Tax=Abeliophyllum distichum TaxID=126358 RepID=A0ABD1TKP0_9LAMI
MVVASGTNVFAKEIAIRKRIASIYNKREEDFPSLREYNDYLEEVEDMICNLIEGVDVPAIEAKIAEYQKENAEQIMNAHARKAEEYAAAVAASKGQPAQTGVDLSSSSQAGTGHWCTGTICPSYCGGCATTPNRYGPSTHPSWVGS